MTYELEHLLLGIIYRASINKTESAQNSEGVFVPINTTIYSFGANIHFGNLVDAVNNPDKYKDPYQVKKEILSRDEIQTTKYSYDKVSDALDTLSFYGHIIEVKPTSLPSGETHVRTASITEKGVIDYRYNYYATKDIQEKIAVSTITTNESVKKVNRLFLVTIIISLFTLIASLFDVYVQLQGLQVQLKKDISVPKPLELKILQPLKVDVPLIKDTLIVKQLK